MWTNGGSTGLRNHGVALEDTLWHDRLDADSVRTSSNKCGVLIPVSSYRVDDTEC